MSDGISSDLAFRWAEKIVCLESALAAERAHADRLAEALRNELRKHLESETVNLLAEHDRMRAERQ